MQTSDEIQTQIAQLESEVKDINKSMTRLSRSQDLIDAMQEVQNRANVIGLLSTRLDEAKERETAEAERARRQENTNAMEAAKVAYEDVGERFNARRLALIRHMTAESDELDPLSFELEKLRRAYQDAWVRNNPERIRDFHNYPQLPNLVLDLTGPEQHARDALTVLYNSRRGYGGTYRELSDAIMNQGYQQFAAGFHNAPRPQELTQPNTAVDDAMAFIDDRMSNRND